MEESPPGAGAEQLRHPAVFLQALNGRHHPYGNERPANFRGLASPGPALVASLTPQERVRLLRLIALPQGGDAPVYRSVPPSRDEFSADEEPLAWDADGWEDVG
jgi:hypothetical protein